VDREVFFVTTITPRQSGVVRSQDQGDLAGVKGAKEIGILPIAGLRQAHGFELARIAFRRVCPGEF
jgi:hypothetical protein